MASAKASSTAGFIAVSRAAAMASGGAPARPLLKCSDTVHSRAAATTELRKLVPAGGSYVSESDYFEADWQRAFWGANLERLQAVKRRYDPDGLFVVHHGVGSERWSADGFTRVG